MNDYLEGLVSSITDQVVNKVLNTDKLLGKKEMAEKMNISVRQFGRLCVKYGLPYYTTGDYMKGS